MNFKLRVLVVEDDNETIKQWHAAIEIYNADPSISDVIIDFKTAKNLQEATDAIDSYQLDAAIIDINLHTDKKDVGNKDGNIVLEKILNKELAVVGILSGEPGLPGIVERPSWAKNVEIFKKGDGGLQQALDWLLVQVPMIRQIKIANDQIKKEMTQLFIQSIWPRWNYWIESNNQHEPFVRDALTRHLTAHVYGVFLEKSENKVHPEEWYFVPSIKTDLRTGDLIKLENGRIEILITPRCDVSRLGKNESFQLAECKDISHEWDRAREKIISAEKLLDENTNEEIEHKKKLTDNVNKAKNEFRQLSQHKGNSNVFHFLPRLSLENGNKLGPFFIHFDKIRSVPRNDLQQTEMLKNSKFASVTPDFLPSIVERLGSFFSRIGTPDYSHSE
jgi:CheY-like chemotaxis protein